MADVPSIRSRVSGGRTIPQETLNAEIGPCETHRGRGACDACGEAGPCHLAIQGTMVLRMARMGADSNDRRSELVVKLMLLPDQHAETRHFEADPPGPDRRKFFWWS